jgi:hypothetical protein
LTKGLEIMSDVSKVCIGKAPQKDAEQLRSVLASLGIEVATIMNPASCTSGSCGVQLEMWAHPEDVASIERILKERWQHSLAGHGHEYDHALAEQIFDPTAEAATCPACATVFATTHAECPECGLYFAAPVTSRGI